jgi:hypothetical protein
MSNLILRIDRGSHAGRQIWLQPGQVVRVGASMRCDCHLPGAYLGEEHFEVALRSSGAFVTALNSAPTVLNGQVVQQGVVRDGDQIVAGTLQFSIHLDGVESQTPSPTDSVTIPTIDWRSLENGLVCFDIADSLTIESPLLQSFLPDGFWLATAVADLPANIADQHASSGGVWVDQIAAQPFETLTDLEHWGRRWSQDRVIGIIGELNGEQQANISALSALLAIPDSLWQYFDAAEPVVGLTFLANMKAILLPSPTFRLITVGDRAESLFSEGLFIEAGVPQGDDPPNDFDPYSESDFGSRQFDSVALEENFRPDEDLNW